MRASCPECSSMRITWSPKENTFERVLECIRCGHTWEVDLSEAFDFLKDDEE